MNFLLRIRARNISTISLHFHHHQHCPPPQLAHQPRFMSTTGSKASGAAGGGKKPFKILMLHGYTQSGPLLDAKTKALTKFLTKTLSSAPYNLDVQYLYPTGPHVLRPSDIPGFQPSSSSADNDNDEENSPPETHAWWRKSDATGQYVGFAKGMHRVASTIQESVSRDNHPLDGVLGFSQGGCLAAIVASALESSRGGFAEEKKEEEEDEEEEKTWLPALRKANLDQPLKFCVVYAGFWATDAKLQWLYEAPKISTPSCHFVGSLDTVVDEERTEALLEKWEEGKKEVMTHPGGHYVPVAKQWVVALLGFLIRRLKSIEEEEKKKKKEKAAQEEEEKL